ncbi:hypothetical protein QFC22_005769 [Naganishia vaughanmartiniae]|uniref:Uncharacterized protein n=1 Tax=Naganishia vaughanmartiniae TaxID=1424756 RepID=A0ACC2WUW8_9TREE|nr:hypothetical protein QFC22_005769 [Naganishia vaughanmartiniae]
MLGNTYPYTEADWETNLELAEETGIDAFGLNLGPERWQADQARTAYRLSSDSGGGIKLFLSLDMNVLPSSSREDMLKIIDLVEELGRMPGQLKVALPHATDRIWSDDDVQETEKVVLSTFGGGEANFGGAGWEGFLRECKIRGLNIYFIPAFFLPPERILAMPYVDATFNWNSGWPLENDTISTKSDEVYIRNVPQSWLTYRTHPKALVVPSDPIGRPNNADWAQDVISVAVLLPETKTMNSMTIEMEAGDGEEFRSTLQLNPTAQLQTFVVPFGPGEVSFKIKEGPVTLLEGKGAEIARAGSDLEIFNFNAWSGYWNSKVV